MTNEKRQDVEPQEEQGARRAPNCAKHEISETWAEETIADLDDFIESQGIYIRQ